MGNGPTFRALGTDIEYKLHGARTAYLQVGSWWHNYSYSGLAPTQPNIIFSIDGFKFTHFTVQLRNNQKSGWFQTYTATVQSVDVDANGVWTVTSPPPATTKKVTNIIIEAWKNHVTVKEMLEADVEKSKTTVKMYEFDFRKHAERMKKAEEKKQKAEKTLKKYQDKLDSYLQRNAATIQQAPPIPQNPVANNP
jgi:hypothetical protein